MENDGIIRKIAHHTDWCSSITTRVKKYGSLRVCLDPRRLNINLKRCPPKIPSLEELTPEFAEARVFSKYGRKGRLLVYPPRRDQPGDHHFPDTFREVLLQEASIWFVCVPIPIPAGHGPNPRAPGCVGIADHIVVYGHDDAEHDKNLMRVMQVAKEEGLVFNSKKCAIKTSEILFFGSVYGKNGIRPDPSKIEDIRKMPTPQDREDLQRFISLMNYLAAYIPHFADNVSPLRELLKKDVPFV